MGKPSVFHTEVSAPNGKASEQIEQASKKDGQASIFYGAASRKCICTWPEALPCGPGQATPVPLSGLTGQHGLKAHLFTVWIPILSGISMSLGTGFRFMFCPTPQNKPDGLPCNPSGYLTVVKQSWSKYSNNKGLLSSAEN